MSKVKKLFFGVFIFFIFLGAYAEFSYAQSQTGTVTASKLHLRTGPGLTYTIIGNVMKGDTLIVIEESSGWCKIDLKNGKYAWACKDYISFSTASGTEVSRGSLNGRTQTDDSDNSSIRQDVVDYANTLIGIKYASGGNSPDEGFDCSGFVGYVFKHFSIDLPRVSTDIAKSGTAIKKADLQPGDIVAFDTNGGKNKVNHVGIYIGNGQFIHAATSYGKVRVSDLSEEYYKNNYMGACQVIK